MGSRSSSVTWRSRAPERGPGPARRGEGRVRRPPPRPTPSRGGREPGAGRGRSRRCLGAVGRGRRPRSAAEAGSAGSSSRLVRCAPGVRAVRGTGRARCGSTRRACSGKISLGEPSRRASIALGLGRSARNEGDRFLQLASLAAQETGLCFLRLEKWTKTVKAVEVGRNPHQGI